MQRQTMKILSVDKSKESIRDAFLRKKYTARRLREVGELADKILEDDSLVTKVGDLTINFKQKGVILELGQLVYNEILSSKNDVEKKASIMDTSEFIDMLNITTRKKNKLKRRAEETIIEAFNSPGKYEHEFLLHSSPSNSTNKSGYNGFSTQEDETIFYVSKTENLMSIGYRTERTSGTGKEKVKNNKIIRTVKIR